MARQWRIEFEGALYHILSRGNQGQNIFIDDKDRRCFLNLLGDMCNRFFIDIFAYVFMNNHYHILLRTQQANLSNGMQWLGTTYTRRFNWKHSQSGHLFQGRYKSIIVENDAYLSQLSYYIHRNPLRAGLVDRLADYPWSSYAAYAYGKKHPAWLKTKLILEQFNSQDRQKAYRQKVQKYSGEKKRIWEDVAHGFIYGSQNFIDRIKSDFLSDQPMDELPQAKSMLKDIRPEKILFQAAKILKCNVDGFRQSRRISATNKDKRDILLYLLWETGRYKNREIGNLLGLSCSSISRRANITRERLKKSKRLKKTLNRLKSIIKV